MNHQPFESWLFSEEQLDAEKSESLESHLTQCETCRHTADALDEIYQVIASSTTPEPRPGFTNHWYQHLAEYRQKRQKRHIWALILTSFILASIILLSLFFVNFTNFNWGYGLGQFVGNISLFAVRFRKLFYIARSAVKAFPIIIPITLVFGVGSLSAAIALIITWFSSIIRLYQPVQEGVNNR